MLAQLSPLSTAVWLRWNTKQLVTWRAFYFALQNSPLHGQYIIFRTPAASDSTSTLRIPFLSCPLALQQHSTLRIPFLSRLLAPPPLLSLFGQCCVKLCSICTTACVYMCVVRMMWSLCVCCFVDQVRPTTEFVQHSVHSVRDRLVSVNAQRTCRQLLA
jgi:hypothetical protein